MSHNILLADPDFGSSLSLIELFLSLGYLVDIANDAKTALAKGTVGTIDLVVLDVGLPDDDGFSVCRRLRDCGLDVPILLLSAGADTSDMVKAFQHGADEYLAKPLNREEMQERVSALLRRTRSRTPIPATERRFGDIYVDFLHGTVLKAGEPVSLSGKELRLLQYLVFRSPLIVPRTELLTEVWGYLSRETRTVDVHVAALRRKLEADPHRPRHIVTERGRGYRFRE